MNGLTITSATCPPQVVPVREHDVPVLEFSSKRTMSKPSFWKAAFFTSGSMLVCSQLSAVEREQSCASSQPFGTTNENCGNAPLARSTANWEKLTSPAELMLVMYASGS